MDQSNRSRETRRVGVALILFAIAFNLPYAWLASTFDYPAILRSPPGLVLGAFADGGPSLILTWAAFALAALLLALIAVAVGTVTQRSAGASSAIAALGVAAGVTQAIGLSRWVYAVPGLAAQWEASAADPVLRASIETTFTTLHQFAGVGIGVALEQRRHPRFGGVVSGVGLIGGVVLLLGLAEGLATVIPFDPGLLGLSGVVGFLVLTVWMIWTGALCILRPAAAS